MVGIMEFIQGLQGAEQSILSSCRQVATGHHAPLSSRSALWPRTTEIFVSWEWICSFDTFIAPTYLGMVLESNHNRMTIGMSGVLVGSEQLRETDRMEQRVAERYAGGSKSFCQLFKKEEGQWLPAWIRDISSTGINLLTKHRFEPGTLVLATLENEERNRRTTLELVVMHTIQCPNDAWFHGAAFSRNLTDEELKAFVEGQD
jgi:hypothetical protein